MEKIRRKKRHRTLEWRSRPHFRVVQRITDRSGREWLVGREDIGITGLPSERIITHCPVGCGREIDTTSASTVTCWDCRPKFRPTAPPWESKATLWVPATVRDAADRVRDAINSIEARLARAHNEDVVRGRSPHWGGGTTLGIPDC